MSIWNKFFTGKHKKTAILSISAVAGLIAAILTAMGSGELLMVIMVFFAFVSVLPCILFVLTSETVVKEVKRLRMKPVEAELEAETGKTTADALGRAEAVRKNEPEPVADSGDPLPAIWRQMRNAAPVQHDDSPDLSALCEQFESFAADAGLLVTSANVRELFSAMASSRLILLKTEGNDASGKAGLESFVTLLSAFFGTKLIEGPSVVSKTKFSEVLYVSTGAPGDGDLPTPFFKELYRSKYMADSVRPVLFRDVVLKEWQSAFAAFLPYFQDPALAPDVTVAHSGTSGIPDIERGAMKLPINLWFFLLCPDVEQLGKEWSDFCVPLRLRIEGNPGGGMNPSEKPISYDRLTQLFRDAENQSFSGDETLEYWKRYDLILQAVSEQFGYVPGNRIVRTFERFYAIPVTCGIDPVTAFDGIFARLLVPALFADIKGADAADADAAEAKWKTILEVADETFGGDRLPETHDAVRRALDDLRDAMTVSVPDTATVAGGEM